MGNANFNEIGYPIRINFSEDISSATPTLILQPQLGAKKEITDGVTIPIVDVTVGSQTRERRSERIRFAPLQPRRADRSTRCRQLFLARCRRDTRILRVAFVIEARDHGLAGAAAGGGPLRSFRTDL